MKKTLRSKPLYLVVLVITAALVSFTGCGPNTPPGPNGNAASNGANLLPPPTATPSPTPACDDQAVNAKLLAEFNKPSNNFGTIKRTVNFYSKDCTVFVWGYAKNFRTYKRLERVIHDDSKARTPETSVNMVNLELFLADYEPGAPACGDGYKKCNDICIPQDDPCITQIAIATPSPAPSQSP